MAKKTFYSKGAHFEREVAKQLSSWMTGGRRHDLFWRTAMSGGRATIANRNKGYVRSQLGDITAVDYEGYPLTEKFVIEAKYHADLSFTNFFLNGGGPIVRWWDKLVDEAERFDKHPMLVLRQNRRPILILMWQVDADKFTTYIPEISFYNTNLAPYTVAISQLNDFCLFARPDDIASV